MNVFKDDLKAIYASQKGITKVEAEERINDILGLITSNLVAGNNVKINNFFNFFAKERKAKEGKNPITGAPMIIPTTKTVLAKMTKPLKDRIQGKR